MRSETAALGLGARFLLSFEFSARPSVRESLLHHASRHLLHHADQLTSFRLYRRYYMRRNIGILITERPTCSMSTDIHVFA